MARPLHQVPHQALPLGRGAVLELLAPLLEGVGPDVASPEHDVLLADLPDVGRRPVHKQAGGEQPPPEPEQGGHEIHQGLGLRIGGARWAHLLHLPLLVEGRAHHHGDEHEIGDLGRRGASTVHLSLGSHLDG